MKNIILQHWCGEPNELCKASMDNISRYAHSVGSEYRLITGTPFRDNLSSPCQKIFMLDPEFDQYDIVVMVDADMFVRKGMCENIFETPGVGMNTYFQKSLHARLCRKFPKLCSLDFPYWGGAIYKLDRDIRKLFRSHIRNEEIVLFDNNYQDEGIMHRLAVLSNYHELSYLPGEFKWCHCSYRIGIETSSFIHVRTKIIDSHLSPKRTKIENYNLLVDRGLI